MATLTILSGSTFIDSKRTASTAKNLSANRKRNRSPTPSLCYSRSRHSGIREHTDESYDLPNSNDILQHLSESCRNQEGPQLGTDGHDDFDHLEAEIDQLKEDVSRLRQESDQGRPASKAPEESKVQLSLAEHHSHSPPSTEHEPVSAAARLQRLHEEADLQRHDMESRPEQPSQPPPPSPLDFPVLVSPTVSSSSKAAPSTDTRKPSYADAAMSGIARRVPKDVTSTETGKPTQGAGEEVSSTISSPISGQHERASEATEKFHTTRQAPHFAQPTKSFARRAGETLRKEVGTQPKGLTDTPSPKSARSKETSLATEQRSIQRHQKRKSLPGGWMSGSQEHGDNTVTSTPDDVQAAVDAKRGARQHKPSAKGSPVESKSRTEIPPPKVTSRVAQAQRSPRRHQNTTSYMSPMSATTHRTAPTLSKEKSSPSPTKKPPRWNTSHVTQLAVTHSPENTLVGSDSSSVQFILDRPAILDSPTYRNGSPILRYIEEQQAVQSNPALGPLVDEGVERGHFGSSTKVTRMSRMHENSSPTGATDQRVSPPDPTTLYTMPTVANTVTVRRTSNNQILRPILARLSAEGLARAPGQSPQSPTSATTNLSNALNAAREGSPRDASISDDRPEFLTRARVAGPLLQGIPFHARRQRGISTASTLTDITAQLPIDSGSLSGQAAVQAGQHFPSLAAPRTGTPPHVSPSSFLRATAVEFTPMQQPAETCSTETGHSNEMYQHQTLTPYNLEALTSFRTPEEWLHTPVQIKQMISHLRSLRHVQPSQTLVSNWHRQPRLVPVGGACQPPHATCGFTSIDDNGSTQIIAAGQTANSDLSPAKKSVHWTQRDDAGAERALRFGRAAAPPPEPAAQDSPHPTISPTSDDTSSLATPRRVPANPWSIGSAASRMPYGWTGGDGREIRFVGYGPHAERDPNSAVIFDFAGRRDAGSPIRGGPGHDDKENLSSSSAAGVAPRSQTQWAQKLGLARVPCGRVQITHATEAVPFASQLAGYCHDCWAER